MHPCKERTDVGRGKCCIYKRVKYSSLEQHIPRHTDMEDTAKINVEEDTDGAAAVTDRRPDT